VTPGRPSEAISAVVGSILGAIVILLDEWFEIVVSAKALGALIILVAWVAYAVTSLVARRQRSGKLVSEKDGSVSET
jgi:drug/metabolite transporter (DMT)-like permease